MLLTGRQLVAEAECAELVVALDTVVLQTGSRIGALEMQVGTFAVAVAAECVKWEVGG